MAIVTQIVMITLIAMVAVMPLIDLWELDAMHPVICGSEDGNATNPATCGGLMPMLMALGMLMAMLMVLVMANHPCRVAMLMATVILMTMVMECHSPFDLWEVCTL